tara:strand:- start:329 stop:3337 length:3009 start_codon:yes stop_codon:yes gene_type:complete
MTSYVDTELLECSRASSIQEQSNNNENPALFTNKMGESVILNSGDKISLEKAFINGLGAGNQKTIQFTGKFIPQLETPESGVNPNTKYITYCDVIKTDIITDPTDGNYRMGYANTYQATEVKTPITLTDNLQDFTIGYYINNNQYPYYIQLPRRFQPISESTEFPATIFKEVDGFQQGFPHRFPIDATAYLRADWERTYHKDTSVAELYADIKQRIDNKRFTLFMREKTYHNITVSGAVEFLPPTEHRNNPLWKKYIKYVEKKTFSVKKGFNTPQEIATQLTNQLNESGQPTVFNVVDAIDDILPLTETIEQECYKPFNVANAQSYNKEQYTEYITDKSDNRANRYFNNFSFLGVKRPELFVQGRSIPQSTNIEYPYQGLELNEEIPLANHTDTLIKVKMIYNKENLTYWKTLFDYQKIYPELWEDFERNLYNEFTIKPKFNNTGMLHMNRFESDAQPYNNFGSEGLEVSASYASDGFGTNPLFVHYDENPLYYEPNAIPVDKYSLGFAKAYVDGFNVDGSPIYKIAFKNYPNGGIPTSFFILSKIKINRKLGYDWNSTAYGSAMIVPYAGYTYEAFFGSESGAPNWNRATKQLNQVNINTTLKTDVKQVCDIVTQSYIGAINPRISYNENDRFEFSSLHSNDNVGNVFDAGDPLGRNTTHPTPGGNQSAPPAPAPVTPVLAQAIPIGINANANLEVYKVNPPVYPIGFAPQLMPYYQNYETVTTLPYTGTAEDIARNVRNYYGNNPNLSPYAIFDTHSGIYFDDFGVNEREWSDSMWGILGFSYSQFHSKESALNNPTQRVQYNNKFSLYKPTTNSEIESTDTKSFIVNEYGASLYTPQVPLPMTMNNWGQKAGVPGAPAEYELLNNYNMYPSLNIPCNSIAITAQNLSKQMLQPFYTVRSDILSSSKYRGSNNSGILMPVIGIIDRYGAEGDYYFSQGNNLDFTITTPTIFSDITTSIHNPDGSFAVINNNSGVIYKVERLRMGQENIIEQIMERLNKKK